jgi:aminopeptidase N
MLPGSSGLDRSSLLDVTSYDVALDLTGGSDRFRSRSAVRFRCRQPGAGVFADLHAASARRATLNGAGLDLQGGYRDGRLALPRLAEDNVLVVDAEFAYASAAEGLHYVTDPADGSPFLFSKSSSGGASRIYCCFDQPDLRAPFTVSVRAPAGWTCLANAPELKRPAGGEHGIWRFAPTAPIPPWLTSLCAGVLPGQASGSQRDGGRPLPVTVRAVPSAAAFLEPLRVPELLRQPLAYYERTLGVPYPYGKCDQVFGPVSPALAYSVTGLIVIHDQVLRESQEDGTCLYPALVIAHELAHAWFGGLVTLARQDSWLDEALTTYISRTALAEITPGTDPWTAPISAALPDDYYAADAAAVRQLENIIGRPAVLNGLAALLQHHAHNDATKNDLIMHWSQASRQDLRHWAAETLMPASKKEDPARDENAG